MAKDSIEESFLLSPEGKVLYNSSGQWTSVLYNSSYLDKDNSLSESCRQEIARIALTGSLWPDDSNWAQWESILHAQSHHPAILAIRSAIAQKEARTSVAASSAPSLLSSDYSNWFRYFGTSAKSTFSPSLRIVFHVIILSCHVMLWYVALCCAMPCYVMLCYVLMTFILHL